MAYHKVVKVDEVHRPPRRDPHFVPAYDRALTNQTSSELLAYGTESSLLPTSRLDYDSNLCDDDGDEALDKVYELPENWPKLPAIFRRRSCELTTASNPCVNKVVSHLELLQDVIEDWFKETGGDTKRTDISKQNTAASFKEMRLTDKRGSISKRMVSASSTRPSTGSRKGLSVQGIGFKEDSNVEDDSVPYLGAEEAVTEVMTLLARLENDRQETERMLDNEKERVLRLGARIDYHCQRRMKELPEVVQKEHEECIVDINELQWHVSYASRSESRIQDRVDIAKVLNQRLKQDTEFVNKHIPLVEEKLELEQEAMRKIKNAQTDTNQELDNTRNRQEKTEVKSTEASQKAEKERDHIKKELDTVRDALSAINEELSDAKMTYNSYTHQINDIQQNLKDNDQELKVLEVKNENARVAEELQAAKVQDITSKILDSEFEQSRLDTENLQLQAALNSKKKQYSNTITELEMAIRGRDSKLRKAVIRNQEVESDIQDSEDKKMDCQRQKDMDEKNIKRIHKEMQKIQGQLSVTMDEYNRIAAINASIHDQLIAEQEKTHKMEESLKVTTETLKRQVKDEIHTRTVLAARIMSDAEELQKSRGDMKQKKNKEQAAKVADEVVTAVKTVKEKVDKLRSAKESKVRKKADLSEKRNETIKQMKESEVKFESRKQQLAPHHSNLREHSLNVKKRLDHIEWKSDVMNNQIADMDKSQPMMDRLTNSASTTLENLNAQLVELELQIQAAQRIEDDLKIQYNDVLVRVRDNNARHRKFVEERNTVKRDLETKKNVGIAANKELASKYRTLQNTHMMLKDKYINNFEDRVKLENGLKDTRELQALQIRMYSAMMEYYKYRGLYNTSELSRMEDMSIKNSEKVNNLQEQMNSALVNITSFLQTQMTGEAIKKTARDNLQRQERRAAAKERRAEMKARVPTTVSVAS